MLNTVGLCDKHHWVELYENEEKTCPHLESNSPPLATQKMNYMEFDLNLPK